MKAKYRKIVLYLFIGLMVLSLESILYQIILNELGDLDTFFGIPFNMSSFLFGAFFLFFIIIMYLLFPKTKRKIDKHSTL